MYRYHCLNPISNVGLKRLHENYEVVDNPKLADGILVRSADMHEMEFSSKLKAVARAGAGVNNIPLKKCAEKGIVVFNTPGANANAVKELVIAGMLLAARDIIGGANWVVSNKDDENIAKTAEKKKKAFAGGEITGKKLGVIGLGAIGIRVANTAVDLGMDVYGYDPYMSVDAAWHLSRSIRHAKTVEEIYNKCDYITIHVPALPSTKEMINEDAIGLMKNGVVVLNFARDVLVKTEAMLDGLRSGKVKRYVTDFAVPEIAGAEHAIVLPHLGASTAEAEDNCAKMAVSQMMDYLENGNIRNSVNYPDCDMGKITGVCRIAIHHQNIPNMLGQFTGLMASQGANISVLTNKSNKDGFAYTLLELDTDVSRCTTQKLEEIEGVIKVRLIRP